MDFCSRVLSFFTRKVVWKIVFSCRCIFKNTRTKGHHTFTTKINEVICKSTFSSPRKFQRSLVKQFDLIVKKYEVHATFSNFKPLELFKKKKKKNPGPSVSSAADGFVKNRSNQGPATQDQILPLLFYCRMDFIFPRPSFAKQKKEIFREVKGGRKKSQTLKPKGSSSWFAAGSRVVRGLRANLISDENKNKKLNGGNGLPTHRKL